MGKKVPGLNDTITNITNMTSDEFDALYDPSVTDSLGYTIAQVDKLISTTYSCADENLCTHQELSLMQWTTSAVTKKVPDDLEGNRFIGRNG